MAGDAADRTGGDEMARTDRRTGWKRAGWQWGVGGALAVASVVVVLVAGPPSSHHPEPRDGIDHSHVVPADRYASFPRVAAAYEKVAAIPHVIDGIYCYCDCSGHSGHHSLLDCFHDDHGAYCDICLSQAEIAYRMHVGEGKSLEEIRQAMDRLYRS
jgi:hypothetical protein